MISQEVIKRSDVLKRCRGIYAEIKQLEAEIKKQKAKDWDYSVDCVIGSSREEPYQQHAISVGSWNPSAEATRHINHYVKQIEEFRINLLKMKLQSEDYLETIPDSIDRIVLRGYYIEGKEWKDVAADLSENSGKDYSESAVKMRAQRFFEKN